jgi:hypothetical protein
MKRPRPFNDMINVSFVFSKVLSMTLSSVMREFEEIFLLITDKTRTWRGVRRGTSEGVDSTLLSDTLRNINFEDGDT